MKLMKSNESENKMSKKFETAILMTPVFRASFPYIFELNTYDEKKPQYSIIGVWDVPNLGAKDKAAFNQMCKTIEKLCQKNFGKSYAECKETRGFKWFLKDVKEKAGLEGFQVEGGRYATMSNKMKVGVIGLDNEEISPAAGNSDRLYAGVYARASVTMFCYDNKHGTGISLGIRSLQVIKDAERLDGGVVDAQAEFADADVVDDSWLEADAGDTGSDATDDDIPF